MKDAQSMKKETLQFLIERQLIPGCIKVQPNSSVNSVSSLSLEKWEMGKISERANTHLGPGKYK